MSDYDDNLSEIELQIQRHQRHPTKYLFSDAGKKRQRIADFQINILDNIDDAELKTVMKSYVRQNFENVRRAIMVVGFKDALKDETEYCRDSDFLYRLKPYPENIILKLIIYEYLFALFDEDITFENLENIQNYLDKIFG